MSEPVPAMQPRSFRGAQAPPPAADCALAIGFWQILRSNFGEGAKISRRRACAPQTKP
jgi:hypothetical protein